MVKDAMYHRSSKTLRNFQVRTEETDGYAALQLGFDDKSDKNASAAHKHFKKAGTCQRKLLSSKVLLRMPQIQLQLIYIEGEFVDVSGTALKGFCELETSRLCWCRSSNSRST
jgi:ribosomal protein L3